MTRIEEYAEEEWDDECPDATDVDEDDDDEGSLLVCPSCKEKVHEDTQQCPYCGDWIIPVHSDAAWQRWVWVTAALLVVAALTLLTVF